MGNSNFIKDYQAGKINDIILKIICHLMNCLN